MLTKMLVAVMGAVVVALSVPASALASPVTDDGEVVTGRFGKFHYRHHGGRDDRTIYYRGKWITETEYFAVVRRCEALGGRDCGAGGIFALRESAERTAISIVARLRLPDPTPQFGPDPSVNEWKMLAVGFPVWLWTAGPAELTTSVSSGGETFTMTARRKSVRFAMGDGRSVTCNSMSRYSESVKPGRPSPTCGYVYQKPSLPAGSYTVRSTVNWEVSWSVAGYSGVLPTTRIASRALPIGELVALNR